MTVLSAVVCLLLLSLMDRSDADRSKIFVGLREIVPNTYPSVGWILIGIKRVKCGVTLVTRTKALTAASCITGGIDSVYFGDHSRSDTTGNEQVFTVASTVSHPDYNATSYEYDIAILTLDSAATLNNVVGTLPLLPNDGISDNVLGKHCRVVGWGYEVAGATDAVRDQSDVPYEITVDRTSSCTHAGAPTTALCYEPFRDPASLTCEGDSGGAYICKRKGVWNLAGIMSDWMVGEGCTDGPRAAISIPASYDWLQANL